MNARPFFLGDDVGKWIEAKDQRGRVRRFPYRDDVGVPPGYHIVTDPEPVTDAPIQPVAVQDHPVAEFFQHPELTRESAPGEDLVGVSDEIDIQLHRAKRFKVKGWPQ